MEVEEEEETKTSDQGIKTLSTDLGLILETTNQHRNKKMPMTAEITF